MSYVLVVYKSSSPIRFAEAFAMTGASVGLDKNQSIVTSLSYFQFCACHVAGFFFKNFTAIITGKNLDVLDDCGHKKKVFQRIGAGGFGC